jgi:tetratricopeptide (TPR) repeat protein
MAATGSRRLMPTALVAVAVGCAVAAVTVASTAHPPQQHRASARASVPTLATPIADTGLGAQIATVQQRLRVLPGDWDAWAGLGLDYVQQAKVTVDPTFYPKAEGALAHSLRLNHVDNVTAFAGEATLAAARHDFRAALTWARRGLGVSPRNAVLLGALCDAQTQLGNYPAAQTAAARMESVSPGTDAEARLSYAAELRGELKTATAFMATAESDAGTPADIAFTDYYLGDLAIASGHSLAALSYFDQGLARDPSYVALFEGRARAEISLGRHAAAERDLATAVDRVPQPAYVLEYGELLQSVGRSREAQQQYSLFKTEEQLFRANGVTLDTDETLFEADHGDVRAALAAGRASLSTRPFLDSYDADGWALHVAGQDTAALRMSDRALSSGYRSALFRFHRGVIEHALHRDAAAQSDLVAALRINPVFNPLQAPVARRLLATLEQAR